MSSVFTEITQLSEKDCFHIVERHKTEFTYPLHRHKEFELNFIEHGAGVRRIVGDSVEENGCKFEVLDSTGFRVLRVRVIPLKKEKKEAAGHEQ